MTKRMIALSMALAITAGNIAISEAASLRLKDRNGGGGQPVAGQLKTLGGGQQGGGQHGASDTLKAPFVPYCVTGFQKFDQNSVGSGNNKKIQSYKCRTGWIECPEFPGYVYTGLKVDTDYQGDPDTGGKIRIVYECFGWNPAG